MDYKLIYLAQRNPAVSEADWPKTWRSHANYAASFPVLDAQINSLHYASRIYRPELDGAPVDPPGLSHEHDGVAVIASPFGVHVGGTLAPEDREKILKDEERVFRVYTPNFSFRCKEVLVEGGPPGAAAVVRFLARRAETTPQAFLERWNGAHARTAVEAARASGGFVRYVHDELVEPAPADYPFDGVAETWFETPDDAVRFAARTTQPERDDLAQFCDLERSVTMLTKVIHGWPRDKPKAA